MASKIGSNLPDGLMELLFTLPDGRKPDLSLGLRHSGYDQTFLGHLTQIFSIEAEILLHSAPQEVVDILYDKLLLISQETRNFAHAWKDAAQEAVNAGKRE